MGKLLKKVNKKNSIEENINNLFDIKDEMDSFLN